MKVLVFFSGGKDSQACLIHSVKLYGVENCEAVFCDTGWEHPYTYEHIKSVTSQMGVKLVTLRSEKYEGMIDLVKKRKGFPAPNRRFCTTELKSIPAIDYVLSHKEHLIIIEGIRSQESFSRSKMEPACTYFKWYFQPMTNGKTHTYRKKDVVKWCAEYNADKIRPVFAWSGQEVIDYIKANRQEPNPLYSMGFSRVGCFPCIMSRHLDIINIEKIFPDQLNQLEQIEKEIGKSFFGPGYIPDYAQTGKRVNGKKIPTINDIKKYLTSKNATGDLFQSEGEGTSCMSYYGLCE